MSSGLLYLHSSDRFISNVRGVWLVLFLPYYIEIPVFNANIVDPDPQGSDAAYCGRGLIWVYTFCQWPIYGTLGLNGLMCCGIKGF